jgi:hypothetical protein
MAGIMSKEQLLRELRILYANRPMQFTKLITKYHKGEGNADPRHAEYLALGLGSPSVL